MKITKYPQSCVLVDCTGTQILVDPGHIKYDEKYLQIWQTADAVLITHKHGDHIHPDVLLGLGIPMYSTKEVALAYPMLDFIIVGQGDKISIGNSEIEVTAAFHGYNPRLKNGGEVFENVGYIINDQVTKLYITSDTICFNNDYRADVVMAPVTGYGLTMTAFESALFAKETGARLLLVSHLDNSTYASDIDLVKKTLTENNIEFIILENDKTIEI